MAAAIAAEAVVIDIHARLLYDALAMLCSHA